MSVGTNLGHNPSTAKKNTLLILGGAVLWGSFHTFRPKLYRLDCHLNPSSCLTESINVLDRSCLNFRIPNASFLSDHLQTVALIFALLIPGLSLYFSKTFNKKTVTSYLVHLLQAIILNGILTETIRLIIQRPRPFLFNTPPPLDAFLLPMSYTSFVSGHTSFAAVCMGSVFFFIQPWKKTKSIGYTLFISLLINFPVIMMGILRVGCHRHFVTDTIGGAISGWIAAYLIFYKTTQDSTIFVNRE